MIDKQIIAEMIEEIGFDVQQCGYLKIIKDSPNYPEIGGTFTAFECNLYCRDCKFIERCRYKQLLCKEKEYEELKKQLIEFMNGEYCANGCAKMQSQYIEFHNNLVHQLDQLKTENEELKKEIAFGNNGTLSDKIRAIVFKDLNKENNKLKQTLAEIKEVMKKHCRKCKKHKFYNFKLCCTCKYTDILQKISEVENVKSVL